MICSYETGCENGTIMQNKKQTRLIRLCFTAAHQWLCWLDRKPRPRAARSQPEWGKDTEGVKITHFCSIYKSFVLFFPCSHTHLSDDATVLVEGNDGLGRLVIQVQALLDGLLVVVRASAGLAALHKPLDHGLTSGVDVQQQAGFADLQGKRTSRRFKVTPCRGSSRNHSPSSQTPRPASPHGGSRQWGSPWTRQPWRSWHP